MSSPQEGRPREDFPQDEGARLERLGLPTPCDQVRWLGRYLEYSVVLTDFSRCDGVAIIRSRESISIRRLPSQNGGNISILQGPPDQPFGSWKGKRARESIPGKTPVKEFYSREPDLHIHLPAGGVRSGPQTWFSRSRRHTANFASSVRTWHGSCSIRGEELS